MQHLVGYLVELIRPRMVRRAALCGEAGHFVATRRLGPGSVSAIIRPGPERFRDGMFYRDDRDRVQFVPSDPAPLPPAVWRVAGFATRTAQQTARGRVFGLVEGGRIATPTGERPVETITAGDLVLTRDSGPRRVKWAGRTVTSGLGLHAPVEIGRGVIDTRSVALTVAPWQRLLFEGPRAHLLFGSGETLVAAETLVDDTAVRRRPRDRIAYHGIAFGTTERIFVNGSLCETLAPEDLPFCALEAEAPQTLLTAFPHLAALPLATDRPTRRCLDQSEARMLLVAMGFGAGATDADGGI